MLLDLRLPQMSGDTFFLAILRRWPRLPGRVILMSGDPWPLRPDWPDELRRLSAAVKALHPRRPGRHRGAVAGPPAARQTSARGTAMTDES